MATRMNDLTDAGLSASALFAAADLQDSLLQASSDLGRLQTLLDHSHETLQSAFFGTLQALEVGAGAPLGAEAIARAREQLFTAVKALQFQDMATQLIAHTTRCLHDCADRLAQGVFADDGDGQAAIEDAPMRANPVGQAEMDTGFVELF